MNQDKPVVYISGPISKIPGGNKEAFYAAQKRLEHDGFEVLNPHDICSEIRPHVYRTEKEFWNACMKACIKSMMDADIVMVLKGFTNSEGAMMEIETAKRVDIQVKYYIDYLVGKQ